MAASCSCRWKEPVAMAAIGHIRCESVSTPAAQQATRAHASAHRAGSSGGGAAATACSCILPRWRGIGRQGSPRLLPRAEAAQRVGALRTRRRQRRGQGEDCEHQRRASHEQPEPQHDELGMMGPATTGAGAKVARHQMWCLWRPAAAWRCGWAGPATTLQGFCKKHAANAPPPSTGCRCCCDGESLRRSPHESGQTCVPLGLAASGCPGLPEGYKRPPSHNGLLGVRNLRSLLNRGCVSCCHGSAHDVTLTGPSSRHGGAPATTGGLGERSEWHWG